MMKRSVWGAQIKTYVLLAILVLPLLSPPAMVARADEGTGSSPAAADSEGLAPGRTQTMGTAVKGEPYFGYGVTAHLLGQPVAPLLNGVEGMLFNWVRQPVDWGAIEPSPGNLQWDELDEVVEAVNARGLHLLLVLSGSPDWARPAGSDLYHDGPPADLASFAAFAGTLSARYQGLVDAYQVWQAPNLASHWDSPGGPVASSYVRLLQLAHEAIKNGAPEALVVSAAPVAGSQGDSIDPLVYLGEVALAGADSWYDVMGIAVTGTGDGMPAGGGSFGRYAEFAGGKPIWLTELGWDCEAAAARSEEELAAWIVDRVREAERAPAVQLIMVDDFNTALVDPATPPGCSLIRPDWSAHPAFLQLAAMRQESRFFNAGGRMLQAQNRAPQLRVKPYLYRLG